MRRLIYEELLRWKNRGQHLPLLIRGARQVGKTYVIQKVGREAFDNLVEVNFDFQPDYIDLFKTRDPKQLTQAITAALGQPIIPGKTLLFLDEIQECPDAIRALRYFKELMPEQHVIGAGSLLEFVLNEEDFRMPVGRVQYLYLKPLSFQEFLLAKGEEQLLSFLENLSIGDEIPNVVHQKALSSVRQYMILGGMPAVIDEYLKDQDYLACQQLQTVILTTYRNDFGKYASKAQHSHLQRLFERGPGLVGQQFKYVDLDPESRAREIKTAIKQLSDAGLLHQIFASSCSGLPLNTFINEKRFKLLFLDVGLVNRQTNLDTNVLLKENVALLNRGAVAEQFVGQELLANMDVHTPPTLYYWEREKTSSMAEVDYVTAIDGQVIPIEVKAGVTGRLKSLQMILHEKALPVGVRISQLPLSLDKNILSVPLYMTHLLPQLLTQLTLPHKLDHAF